ncbi:MAG: hypothetical protein KAI24_15770 [Planctomycetes bacterium]|nr:hypothetical protein [Planctomycetota bacterium]
MDEAAARLAFEAQIAELREVLDAIPGVNGTLRQSWSRAREAEEPTSWFLGFDVEPSPRGHQALVGLTETLSWCEAHHEQLSLPPFDAVVMFAAGFVLHVSLSDPEDAADLPCVPPDALARAIREHYDGCVAATEEEEQRWADLVDGCIGDYLGSRAGRAAIEPDRLEVDILDADEQVVAVFCDGRPLARYRYRDVDGVLRWSRLQDADGAGPA